MILNYQRFTMSSVGLVSLCLLGFSTVVNAAEAPQSPAQSAKPGQQRPDRKPKPRIDFALGFNANTFNLPENISTISIEDQTIYIRY